MQQIEALAGCVVGYVGWCVSCGHHDIFNFDDDIFHFDNDIFDSDNDNDGSLAGSYRQTSRLGVDLSEPFVCHRG